jgi:hypothetical protein
MKINLQGSLLDRKIEELFEKKIPKINYDEEQGCDDAHPHLPLTIELKRVQKNLIPK